MDAYFVYIISDAMAPALCGTIFTPNFISIFHGVFITIYGMYNLFYYRSIFETFVTIYLRCLLDALDGSVARACHNGTPYGDIIDTTLDALPAICVLYFAWARTTWPSFYHKIAVPIFYGFVWANSASCNHDPTKNFFCWLYYPNANIFVFVSIMLLKVWSMDHRVYPKEKSLPVAM